MNSASFSDPVQETIKTYDQLASEYKERYLKDSDQNTMQPLLEKFVTELQKEFAEIKYPHVLDVGSGAGFDAKFLSEKGLQVTSVDLSDSFLEIAKEVAPKVDFQKMDMRNLSFPDKSFEGVWASASLLHIPKKEIDLVLSGMQRILTINGVGCLSIKEGVGEMFVENNGEGNLPGAKRYFAYYTEKEMSGLLLNVGLEVFSVDKNTNRGNTWLNFFFKKSLN